MSVFAHFDPGPDPLLVLADPGQLERVLGNLLGNAIKYNREGGRIDVTGRTEGKWVRLHVADTGRGIPSEELPHVFERYRRVSSSQGRSGSGLGLAIAKSFIEAMGGEIEAHSEPGRGSRFSFRLPAAPSADE